MIEANRNLAPFVVNRHFSGLPESEREDAISAGFVALVKAAERWNPQAGAKFNTYAYRCICGAVHKYLRDEVNGRGFSGTNHEAMPPGTILSLDAPKDSETALSLGDALPDRGANTEREVIDGLERGEIWEFIGSTLPPMQAEVLRLHYTDELKMEAIAARQGCTRQNISSHHRNAIRTLRAVFKNLGTLAPCVAP